MSRTSARTTASSVSERLVQSPALVLAIVTALSFPILEILLDGERATQFARDVFDGDLPGLVALRGDWIQHGISFWDPHLTGGNAALAQFALPPTTPDFLLSFAIPLFAAYTIAYAAIIWLAGYGMVRFLHDSIGLGSPAALLGGILYAFSFWHYIHGFAIPLLPLTLWLTDRWADAADGRGRYTMALILLATFGLYTGLLQLQLLVAAVQGAYLLATRWHGRRTIRLIGRYVGIWATALLLFAPVLITQLVALGASHRAVWDLYELYDAAPIAALRRTISLFGSAIIGVPVDGLTTGTAEYSGTFFLGGLGLALAVLGAIYGRHDPRTRFLVVLSVSIPVIYLVALLATPIQAAIPLVNSFQFIRVSHLLPFALVGTAAIGADLVLSGRWRDLSVGWGTRLVLAGSIVALAVQAGFAASQAIELGSAPWLLASLAIALGLLVGTASLWITRRMRPHESISSVLVLLVLVMVVGERMLFVRAERGLHAGLGTYAEAMGIDPAMAFIADQPNDGFHRTLAAGTTSNWMLVAGLDETGGYQSIYPLTYHALFGALTDPYLRTDPEKYRYFHEWGNRAAVYGPDLDLELLDLMGVRWVYAKAMDLDGPQLAPAFRSGQVTVYENASVFPRAFVVSRLRPFASAEALLTGLADAGRDELLTTGFVLATDMPAAIPEGRGTGQGATIVRYSPDRVQIEATSDSGGFLVLTDTNAPGWTASVDGVDTPILPVDLAYRAVAVPPGNSTVVFTYQPWFTYLGLALAGGTAVFVGVWGLLVIPLSRRRDGARSSGARTDPNPR